MSERPKLTDLERRAILDGDFPTLHGSGRFEVGETMELTSRVSVRIEKRNLRKGKVVWDYTVIDFRDEFLRRRPPARDTAKPKRGQNESPERYAERIAAWREKRSRLPRQAEIAKAGRASAYDGNTEDPMDAGVVVPPEVQNRFSLDARTRRAQEQERSEEAQKAQLRSFTEAMRQKIRQGEDISHYLAPAQRSEDAA